MVRVAAARLRVISSSVEPSPWSGSTLKIASIHFGHKSVSIREAALTVPSPSSIQKGTGRLFQRRFRAEGVFASEGVDVFPGVTSERVFHELSGSLFIVFIVFGILLTTVIRAAFTAIFRVTFFTAAFLAVVATLLAPAFVPDGICHHVQNLHWIARIVALDDQLTASGTSLSRVVSNDNIQA
jgi:hypothetical protein